MLYKTSGAFWGVGAEQQLLPVPSAQSLSCASAVPSPCWGGCSAALGSKPGNRIFSVLQTPTVQTQSLKSFQDLSFI